MASDLSEKEIEQAILRKLNKLGHFTIKLKDQAAMRNGSYQKGSAFQIRGVSDLVVFKSSGACIWLEIKNAKGKLSEYQERFKNKIQSLGHRYEVVRSVDDAVSVVCDHKNSTNKGPQYLENKIVGYIMHCEDCSRSFMKKDLDLEHEDKIREN